MGVLFRIDREEYKSLKPVASAPGSCEYCFGRGFYTVPPALKPGVNLQDAIGRDVDFDMGLCRTCDRCAYGHQLANRVTPEDEDT